MATRRKDCARRCAAAAAKGTSFGAPTELETQLAARVATLMPSMERIRFVSSGTEAAMSAVRVARAATGCDRIVKFEGCYHGHADAFLVQAGSGAMTLGVTDQPRCVVRCRTRHTARPLQRPCVRRSASSRRTRKQIAAVFVEPIAGNMGVVPPAPGFLQGLRAICDREHALLVFDEVISGFRAAPGGAQQASGVRPDLTCLGKIIGGGLPVGAYGGRADVMDLVAPAGPVYQAGTLSGNPLAMTAGLWSLQQLSSQLYRQLSQARHDAGGRTRGRSARRRRVAASQRVWIDVDAVLHQHGTVTDFQSALTRRYEAYGRFFHAMLDRGIYPPPSQFEAWFLSGAHTEKDIKATIAAARESMRAAASDK